MNPPTKTTGTAMEMKSKSRTNCPDAADPINPAAEFTQMKAAALAATTFGVAQRLSNMTGERNIPPPIPIAPRKPNRGTPGHDLSELRNARSDLEINRLRVEEPPRRPNQNHRQQRVVQHTINPKITSDESHRHADDQEGNSQRALVESLSVKVKESDSGDNQIQGPRMLLQPYRVRTRQSAQRKHREITRTTPMTD